VVYVLGEGFGTRVAEVSLFLRAERARGAELHSAIQEVKQSNSHAKFVITRGTALSLHGLAVGSASGKNTCRCPA